MIWKRIPLGFKKSTTDLLKNNWINQRARQDIANNQRTFSYVKVNK